MAATIWNVNSFLDFVTAHLDVLIALSLGSLLYWSRTGLPYGTRNFKRVGKPWILHMLPGQEGMISGVDKFVEDGYTKVQVCHCA